MINLSCSQAGLSLIEGLIAIVMVSIIMLSLNHFHSVILMEFEKSAQERQAERIAFQLLDIYPESFVASLPNDWQYQINSSQYNQYCQVVEINIQPKLGNLITQERWFCSSNEDE